MQPRGGTELQFEFLRKHVDSKILDKVQICTSIPGKVPLDPNKVNILWQKNSYDQPNLQEFFGNKERHKEYDWYVFNSHWNYEKFRYYFDIPTDRSVVIKNGVTHFPEIKPYQKGDPIKLIFQPTPWRGLDVLLGAMQLVTHPLVQLDVYSSTQVYGDAFKQANESQYEELYEQARQLPNVNYIGYKPNEYIIEQMPNYRMFAYPSTWEETFCISAVECMAAGLIVLTTNFGALYETCSEWPIYINYEKDRIHLAKSFAYAIDVAAKQIEEGVMTEHLQAQQNFYKRFYHWEKKGREWTQFLTGAIHDKYK
jgi:glycosyltransferase involved in cell wall biosynthesis